MTGFMGLISKEKNKLDCNFDIAIPSTTSRIEDKKIINNCWFKRSIINKFINDKIFVDEPDIFICTDGIILNSTSLMNTFNVKDIFHLLRDLYNQDSSLFPVRLRGNFSGAIYDKKQDTWIIFNDHVGSKPVFYYFDEMNGNFIFGSEFKMVLAGMKAIGLNPKMNEIGAYCLLSFGFILKDHTLIDGIKRLSPGSILKFHEGHISIFQYYQLKNTPYIDLPDEQIIEELDRRFQAAIKSEYEKDLEYGYKHIATLSGGLDSRTNVLYGKKIGISTILTICFSQSNYADEKISKQIASDVGYPYLYSSLDNGNYLKDIEKYVLVNDGLVYYTGAAHQYSMLELIDWTNFGLLHTGEIGDLIMGSYLIEPKHHKTNESMIDKVVISKKLIKRIPKEVINDCINMHSNDELFAFYEKCVNGVFNGFRMTEQFTEFSSPFLYIDFLEYAIKIHPKMRFYEQIYLDWIQKKTPEAKKYIWEKTGSPISAGKWRIKFSGLMRDIKKIMQGPSPNDSMNPLEYWYISNPDLKNCFDNYYKINIPLLNNYPILKEDAKFLYEEGSPDEKRLVLTLLAAIKIHELN
jgi:asparagine synthase (glutamine-hydrolysing)